MNLPAPANGPNKLMILASKQSVSSQQNWQQWGVSGSLHNLHVAVAMGDTGHAALCCARGKGGA
jgi:hypothetical protein